KQKEYQHELRNRHSKRMIPATAIDGKKPSDDTITAGQKELVRLPHIFHYTTFRKK
ncbi:hypothetical protein CEXT_8291, partial [Caerostris extrusa]